MIATFSYFMGISFHEKQKLVTSSPLCSFQFCRLFFVPLIEALYDLSAVSRILTMNCETGKVYVSLPEGKSMYLIFQICTIGLETRREKKSSSRFERYCRRSQSDSFKGTKKKEKA